MSDGTIDGTGNEREKTGSPNQPGLSPSDQAQTMQDRLQEQAQSESPSDRAEVAPADGASDQAQRSPLADGFENRAR